MRVPFPRSWPGGLSHLARTGTVTWEGAHAGFLTAALRAAVRPHRSGGHSRLWRRERQQQRLRDSGGGSAESTPAGRDGGEATFAYASFPDYLDPALSYTVAGWQALADTNLPLLTYKRAEGEEGAKLIPGLAEAMPEVSSDGRPTS